ncbi:phage tail protein [Weissella diestrammenae]|uniref:Phage tail protein n=1 Tax=Weissella diestrammenae TaxID=1162633 RepID=A0A7G9T4Q8_9LACO|nr:phage tail protein [Weissella diestrammenae]MCM0582794.1 phage tail protein [Weissella diestrammenae]QNN75083.1 phage tail protein [Weissella diestrammenae]
MANDVATTKKYDKRTATHGNSWGAFAKITNDSAGETQFGTPKIFTGLRANSFETTQDSNPYYADNLEHIRLTGAKAVEGSIKAYQFPRQFAIDHMGYKETENGGLIDTGTFGNFVWQFVETITDQFGGETEQLTIYYNVKASAPTAETATDEDSAEPKEFEIPVTASPNPAVIDGDGKAVTVMTITKDEKNAALFDLAYQQVILPDTKIPSDPETPAEG